MVYKEVPIDKIKDNPFQTRKKYDDGAVTGIATSSMDNIGIRNAPLVRVSPNGNGTYELGSGHFRVRAAKLNGQKTMMVRVENLTDAQMKKEVLVENVNRSNLNEEERFQALEQYRKELGLKKEDRGFLIAMQTATGIPDTTLTAIYDVREIMTKLPISRTGDLATPAVIRETHGLPEKERLKLINKATEEGLGARAVRLIYKAVKPMNPEVQTLILEKDAKLSRKTIEAIATITDVETQKGTIKFIKAQGYNEELALRFIERAKQGNLIVDVKVVNEPESVLAKFRKSYEEISGWGVNERQILGARWGEARKIFDEIEQKMLELKRL